MAPLRRAVLQTLTAGLVLDPRIARAGDRITAQTVGIDRGSPLADPRNIGAEKGVIWGGRERCDPTDAECQQGGSTAEALVQPAPQTPTGFDVSDRVRFAISIAGEQVGTLDIELWRKAAPNSVDAFVRLSRGQYTSSEGEEPASFERSVALRVQRDQFVVMGGLKKPGGSTRLIAGQTRPQRVPVQPTANDDSNTLRNDAAGLVSVRRGGGSFEFGLTTRPSASLDRDWLPIGRVARGMDLIERLNTLPTNNYVRLRTEKNPSNELSQPLHIARALTLRPARVVRVRARRILLRSPRCRLPASPSSIL